MKKIGFNLIGVLVVVVIIASAAIAIPKILKSKENDTTDSSTINVTDDESTSNVGSETTKVETYKGIVYLDPTDLTNECNAENSVSTTGTKTGCMKWYIYAEDEDSYTMILDHNTTALVAWNSSGKTSEGMKEVTEVLTNDTSSWNSSLNARLITADEIAAITGNDSFDKETSINYFYLDGASGSDSKWRTQIANSTNKSNYSWLYDYTYECSKYGCNIKDNNSYVYSETNTGLVYGYWTSTSVAGSTKRVWFISYRGYLGINECNSVGYGLRPVITISKSIIS
jgi:hypothetical protein